MGDWLLAQGAAIQFDALVVVFGVVALWESFRPRATLGSTTVARWFSNFALAAASNALTRLCLPIAGLALALVARDNGWGLLNLVVLPPWLAFVVAVLALDILQYVLHRIVHTVPLFWRVHKVHHSDVDLDCATTIRHHPLESLLIGALELPLLVALGAPPLAVLASAVLTITASTFTHASAVPVAASSTIAPPISVRRNSRSGVLTRRTHAVVPDQRSPRVVTSRNQPAGRGCRGLGELESARQQAAAGLVIEEVQLGRVDPQLGLLTLLDRAGRSQASDDLNALTRRGKARLVCELFQLT